MAGKCPERTDLRWWARKELGPVKAIRYWPSSQKFLLTLPVAEPARLINFVTDARAVLSEKLLGTNSTLLYLIGLWSC